MIEIFFRHVFIKKIECIKILNLFHRKKIYLIFINYLNYCCIKIKHKRAFNYNNIII